MYTYAVNVSYLFYYTIVILAIYFSVVMVSSRKGHVCTQMFKLILIIFINPCQLLFNKCVTHLHFCLHTNLYDRHYKYLAHIWTYNFWIHRSWWRHRWSWLWFLFILIEQWCHYMLVISSCRQSQQIFLTAGMHALIPLI